MSSKLYRDTRESNAPALGFRHVGGPAPVFRELSQGSGNQPSNFDDAELHSQVTEAEQRGYRAGSAATMKRATEQVTPVLASLNSLIQELVALRPRVRRDAEAGTVELAMAVARRILNREISVDSEAILGLVKSAVERLNAREIHKLRVSPGDYAVIEAQRTSLSLPPAVEIAPDAALLPGSAIFETARGEVDASIQTQLEEIQRGLADLVRREGSR